MKQRWYYSLAVKAAAFVLLFALLLGAGFSLVGVAVCADLGFYESENPSFEDSWFLQTICNSYQLDVDAAIHLIFDQKIDGTESLSTMQYLDEVREKFAPENTNLQLYVEIEDINKAEDFLSLLQEKEPRELTDQKLIGSRYFTYGEGRSMKELQALEIGVSGPFGVRVYYYLDPQLPVHDEIYQAYVTFQKLGDYAYPSIVVLALCVMLGIADWVFLMCAMGHRPDVDKDVITLRFIDRVPYDLFIAACGAVSVPLIVLVNEFWINVNYSRNTIAMKLLVVGLVVSTAVVLLLLVILLLSTATRFKSRTLLRNTVIWRICAWCWRGVTRGVGAVTTHFQPRESSPEALEQKQEQRAKARSRWNARAHGALGWLGGLFRMLKDGLGQMGKLVGLWFAEFSLMWKGQLLLIGIILVDFLLLVITFGTGMLDVVFFIALVAFNIAVYLGYLSCLRQMYWLNEGAKKIAAGDLNYRIDTDMMKWEFKEHGETLNTIRAGIDKAVDERMKAVEESVKSERMKNELLANVSHDIKTPLTSIINYVDLLKKEEIEGEKAKEYIGVLDRQSIRLKKLLEDLLEASKASTGNIAVNAAPTSVGELLRQVTGEYAEKLLAAELEPIITLPGKEATIYADGRLLWRVFDNLMANIVKYAMPRTRVYLDLRSDASMTVIAVKNVSRERLNIAADELMERFVRGDASRSTEGSGLGLSIAQSLTELMGGQFGLTIDGDLFKVTLTFPTMHYEPQASASGVETSAEQEGEAVIGEIVPQ